ncbi:protein DETOXIFICATION 24-like isoform X2 [Populus nigra]|uniref:protein DETOXIFICATION 24-like isoform X2 n=1 Tax=Populus nigra TaxID=3691 RepID=UPI002B274ADE|nr:protein DETOXIFICATION 24-like isoform X2 [Populus nigra]
MDNSMEERLISPEELNSDDLKKKVWREFKKSWGIAFPGTVARLTSFGMIVVTQLFMGHVSELDLAAFGLQQSILIRFVNGILIGMSSATETLCGQAYGAGQYHMMGIYLQRSWIIDGVTATILLPLFIFTAPILKLLGQDEDIAIEAGKMSLWFIPILYYYVLSLTIQMYLQAQQKNKIVGLFTASSFLVHVLLSWLFVIKLGLGVAGAMSAFIISAWLLVIGEFVYIFGGWCPHTWKGFTKAAFADMLPLLKLSLSSGVMICINIYGCDFMICLGFLGASSVRVSNELGKGNAKAARFSIKVALVTSVIIGIIFWILCLVFSNEIAYLFTSNEEIAESVSRLHVLLAFSVLLNSIYPVLSGVAIGAGVQSTVAFLNLGSYYVIGVPIGLVLGYVAHLQIQGLWIGLLTGVVVLTLLLSYLTWRIDWDEQVHKAEERLGRFFLEPPKQSVENSNLA